MTTPGYKVINVFIYIYCNIDYQPKTLFTWNSLLAKAGKLLQFFCL
jgi:hypothetical protein